MGHSTAAEFDGEKHRNVRWNQAVCLIVAPIQGLSPVRVRSRAWARQERRLGARIVDRRIRRMGILKDWIACDLIVEFILAATDLPSETAFKQDSGGNRAAAF